MNKFIGITLISIVATTFFITACSSQPQTSSSNPVKIGNPAAIYCQQMGYTYQTLPDGEGGESGICVMPDMTECAAWDFLSGQCGAQFSYCAQNGYETLTLAQGGVYAPQHAVCVDASGKTIGGVEELSRLPDKLTSCSEDATAEFSAQETSGELFTSDLAPQALPASFDWRNNNGNWLTPIKDQGICGSCWAFSAVGAAEAALEIAANNPNLTPDLSEQYLVSDCVMSGGYQNCCGGWEDQALEYIRSTGIPDEACMTYVDGSGCSCGTLGCDTNCTYRSSGKCSDKTCANRCSDWSSRLTKINATGKVATDRTSIKTALVEKGPLTAALYMGGSFDANGVYKCTVSPSVNHAIVLVGYNDAGGYWIVRNSWGSGWGLAKDGYFKVGYGQCLIEKYATYATAEVSSQRPADFSKSAPSDTSQFQPSTLKLKWAASSGAQSYEVCADTTNNNACDGAWTSTGAVIKYTLTDLTPGTYYWQVRAVNPFGSTEANSSTWWSFSVSGITPAYDEKLTTSKVTFDWADYPDAVSYKIRLSESKDFGVLVLNASATLSDYVFGAFLKPSTTYYWQVRPVYANSKGAWSPVYRFQSMDPLAAPMLSSPWHKDNAHSPVTLTWQSATNGTNYVVVVAQDAAFTLKAGKFTTPALSAEFTLPDGNYYWRVRTIDASGGKSPWSEVRKFTVVTPP